MSDAKLSVPGLPDFERRAVAAWFESGGTSQPRNPETWFYDGKFYIVLSNGPGILATYRIRHDDTLKELKRPPRAIAEAFGGDT